MLGHNKNLFLYKSGLKKVVKLKDRLQLAKDRLAIVFANTIKQI